MFLKNMYSKTGFKNVHIRFLKVFVYLYTVVVFKFMVMALEKKKKVLNWFIQPQFGVAGRPPAQLPDRIATRP